MIEIDYMLLPLETLDNVLAACILREGTHYGEAEVLFEDKKAQLYHQLKRGEAKLVYDSKTNECLILCAEKTAQME